MAEVEQYGATSELIKALTAAGSSGSALQAEDLEAVLIEDLYSLNPLVALLPRRQATARVHQIARRTARQAALFEGELAVRASSSISSSTYDRPTVTVKIIDYWGSVTGFQQQASRKFFDSLLLEQQAGIESIAEQLEFGTLWGASGTAGENVVSGGGASGDPYQFNGFDRLIQTNVVNQAGSGVSLALLDNLIDAASGFRGAAQDEKIFITSIGMRSRISGLQTLARRITPDVEFEGGFRMATYRNVPILESDYVKPPAAVASPTGVSAAVHAGGSLSSGQLYSYRIAAVQIRGECVAAAQVSATPSGGNLGVTVSFTDDANAINYKVFRGTNTGGPWSLLAVIPANTYDANGNPTGRATSFLDDGSYTAPAHSTKQQPLEAGEQSIFLLNRNELRGCALVGMIDPLGQPRENFISYIPLAVTKASYDFMMRVLVALQTPWEKLHAQARRVTLT